MRQIYGNVVLITGASSGIGKSTAELLMNNGYKVYGTSRKLSVEKQEIASPNDGFLKMLQLDVCNEESVKNAVDYVVAQEGSIDILVNNAGFGIAGSVEDTTPEEAYSQFNTSFFGVHRMCRQVLPIMRRRKRGLIINIGSVEGYLSIPFQSMYSAAKFALEAFTEVLRIEVKPFGIKAALVEPGDTKTSFTSSRVLVAAAKKNSDYGNRFFKSIESMAVSEQKGPDPKTVANIVLKIAEMKNPPVRITVGFQYKLFAFLKRILPARLVEFVISKMYA